MSAFKALLGAVNSHVRTENNIVVTADGSDLDVSDEMEEIRELLYELIKTNFPSGVMVEHLAKIYRERFNFNFIFW